MKKQKYSLKDELFNLVKVHKISLEIKAVYHSFEEKKFEIEVLENFPYLELKERIYHIRDMLTKYLPQDFKESTKILLKSLPKALDNTKSDNDFGDFIYAPYSEYILYHGCNVKYLSFSLQSLREITKRFSVEFAIRDFINVFPKETLTMLKESSLSTNYHERRLASEGLRPKLPWAKRLTLDYHEPLIHLDTLFYDPTRYVTRSVANHLNDISKIDASLVLTTLKRWKASGKQNLKEMDYIINHALRTLVKQGNEDALAFLGYVKNPSVIINNFLMYNSEIKIGKALIFTFVLEAKEDTKLMVDYIIYFKTKTGRFSPKVYKLKKLSIKKGEEIILKKKHLFRANMSTRKLFVGQHKVKLQINGKIVQSNTFILSEEKR